MGLDSRKCIKYMILVFLSAFSSMQSNFSDDEQISYLVLKEDMCDISRRLQKVIEKIEASDDLEEEKLLQEEEKLLQELWAILGRVYRKIIETTALYCSGYYPDSYSVYDQILVEIGRDAIHLGKIVAWHIPKLVSNPHIPLRVKIKKCAYITSALVIVVLWMKELYKHNKEKQKRGVRQPRFDREHNFYGSDVPGRSSNGEAGYGSDYFGERYVSNNDEKIEGRTRPRLRDF
ncbi:MAG: hypothetical protein WC747_00580 [Candidatus Babeliales bacterium]|jgi:hypothetical protein